MCLPCSSFDVLCFKRIATPISVIIAINCWSWWVTDGCTAVISGLYCGAWNLLPADLVKVISIIIVAFKAQLDCYWKSNLPSVAERLLLWCFGLIGRMGRLCVVCGSKHTPCKSYEISRGKEKDAHSVISVYSLNMNPKDSYYQVLAIVTMQSCSTIVHTPLSLIWENYGQLGRQGWVSEAIETFLSLSLTI